MALLTRGPAADRAELWLAVQLSVKRAAQQCSGQTDVDDVVQDVAEQFLRYPEEFESEAHARSWARTVAMNRLIDVHRRTRSVPVADLDRPGAAEVTEERALHQMALDCARQYMRLHGISESWLLGRRDEPVSAAERAERSRQRRRIQAYVREKIGWPAFVPSWRWLTPAAAAFAMVPIPFIGGSQLPESPAGRPNPPAVTVEPLTQQPSEALAPRVPSRVQPSPATPMGGGAATPPDSGRVVASLPTPWGEAGWRQFEPPPDEPPPPLFCARDLRVSPDVCVDHPLK